MTATPRVIDFSQWYTWPCALGTRSKRYGKVRLNGRWEYRHRLEWMDKRGPIPPGLHVLHHCDNPPCVEVQHLFLGTPGDNARDKMEKGRGRQPRGERNPKARLTAEQVKEIRSRYVPRVVSRRQLAWEYGVGETTIQDVTDGSTWRHLLPTS